MWPVLFITDIGVDPNPRGGDWQYHNAFPNNPNDVFGTWKAAVRTIDNSVIPHVTSVTPDADPAKNNYNLGACGLGPTSCDSAPAGLVNQGYGAEVRWNVATLKDKNGNALIPGHSYRFQFMVHDGDQNKVGGDSGEACVNAQFQATGGFAPLLAVNGGVGGIRGDAVADDRRQRILAGLVRSVSDQTSRILLNLVW